jgi:hypothetical protein
VISIQVWIEFDGACRSDHKQALSGCYVSCDSRRFLP